MAIQAYVGLVVGVALVCVASPVRAADCSASDTATLQTCLDQLGPGDTLTLQAGEFAPNNITLDGLAGLADAPIVIRGTLGPNGERLSHIIGQSDSANVIEIIGSSYIELRDFELSFVGGAIGNSVDLIKFGGMAEASHHIVIDNLDVHDCGNVAISSQAREIHDIVVTGNTIHDIGGSCFYWGYYEDENPLRWAHHSQIVGNLLQRCPADPASETHYGIQLKSGNHDNIVANNVLVDIGGTTRAAIIVYHSALKPVGSPLEGSNRIERNLVIRSRNEGINAAAGAIIANNIIIDAAGIALYLQPRSYGGATYYGSLEVLHNTVVQTVGGDQSHGVRWTADAWSLDDPARPSSFVGNLALMANGAEGLRPPPGTITIDSNATDGNANATPDTVMIADPTAALQSLVFGELGYLVPSDGGELVDPRIAATVSEDHSGAARDATPDIGAYEWTGVLPPPLDEDMLPGDEGGDSTDGSSGDGDSGDGDSGDGGSDTDAGETTAGDDVDGDADSGDDSVGSEAESETGGPSGSDESGCGCVATHETAWSPVIALLTLLGWRRRAGRRVARRA